MKNPRLTSRQNPERVHRIDWRRKYLNEVWRSLGLQAQLYKAVRKIRQPEAALHRLTDG